MAISLRGMRYLKRSSGQGQGQDQGCPSVREVCLLGVSRGWSEGDRVTLSGRSYRVEARQPRAEDAAAGYLHLAPAPATAPGAAGTG
jgi:hypothetical protein